MCKERIWNQGKAKRTTRQLPGNCAKSGFGIKAKPDLVQCIVEENCAKSGFGIKAKLRDDFDRGGGDCAKSGFGIKAKRRRPAERRGPIVQRADLESRQSTL